MATKELKEKMKNVLTDAVKAEIKKDKVSKTIDSVRIEDGIITANFSVRMPKEEGKEEEKHDMVTVESSYQNFTKNFKSPEEFNSFVWDEFFNDFKKE